MSKVGASDAAALSLSPGEIIGGVYRITRTIHEGRHGVVVEAEQVRLGRKVAIKSLAARATRDQAAQRRLTKEAEQISKLHHPHVVQVLDFNHTPNGIPYLVMELLEGKPLSSLLSPGQPLDIPRALKIGSHVASALAAAHSSGVAHRSLTPQNVLLTEAGDEPFARVLGFGVSPRAMGGQSGEHELVPSSRNLAYIAPEQRKPGGLVADELSDQYALGVLLYHMLTGFVPESRGGVRAFFRLAPTIDPPSAHRSGIPPALDRVLLRALSQDPSARFAQMTEFSAALLEAGRNYLRRSSQPTTRPPSPSVNPRPSVQPSSVQPSSAQPHSAARPVPRSRMPSAPEIHDRPTVNVSTTPISTIPERRSTPPASLTDELALLESLIKTARAERPRALEAAVKATLQALRMAEETLSTQVERRASDNRRLFEEVLQAYVGVPDGVLVVRPMTGKEQSLSPKSAFLLSRVDGVMTAGELLQLSPLGRLETLNHLAELMTTGMIRRR